MGKKRIERFCCILTASFLLLGCSKIVTNYYPDKEDPGLAIFSDKGNNLLSCFINGKPWRTINRVQYGAGSVNYECNIYKQVSSGIMDTLIFSWQGYYNDNEFSQGTISLNLAVPKNFYYRSFSSLRGRRLQIDSTTNGFFSTSISTLSIGNPKGNGNIYFHNANFDSLAPNQYYGHIDGLLEAAFPLFTITRGRFDEVITNDNVHL